MLYRAGGTVVLCTASIDDDGARIDCAARARAGSRPSTRCIRAPTRREREQRDGRGKAPSGRTQEIQRLIGRALRAAVDLDALGERTITIDCDVLEADGGTRTASITGGFVALPWRSIAVAKRAADRARCCASRSRRSASGTLEEALALDLVYTEDSAARVDLNLVATGTRRHRRGARHGRGRGRSRARSRRR